MALEHQVSPTVIQTYADYMGFDFDVVLAEPEDPQLVAAVGQIRQVPRTILLNSRGHPVLDQHGGTDFDRLRSEITRLLQGE